MAIERFIKSIAVEQCEYFDEKPTNLILYWISIQFSSLSLAYLRSIPTIYFDAFWFIVLKLDVPEKENMVFRACVCLNGNSLNFRFPLHARFILNTKFTILLSFLWFGLFVPFTLYFNLEIYSLHSHTYMRMWIISWNFIPNTTYQAFTNEE